MTIKPEEILSFEFSRVFRGYSEVEVDEFLEELASQWEDSLEERDKMLREQEEMKKNLLDSQQRIQQLEEDIEDWKKQAEVEKELARREGQKLLREAQARSQKIMEEALVHKKEVEKRNSELLEQYHDFRTRFRTFIKSFLQSMDSKDRELSSLLGKDPPQAEKPKPPLTTDMMDPVDDDDVTTFSLDDFRDDSS